MQKSFFNDTFVVRLSGNDLYHGNINTAILYSGNVRTYDRSTFDSQNVRLTLRYNFNASSSKYRGTGAGNSEKSRL